jgi:hypothetical protein
VKATVRIFDVNGDDEHIAVVRRAINRCTYPWERLERRLTKKLGRPTILVTFEDLTAVLPGRTVWGLANRAGTIRIERTLLNRPRLVQEVFLSEGSHMVDYFALRAAQRDDLLKLYGATVWRPPTGTPWQQSAFESLMPNFIRAFSDITPTITGFRFEVGKPRLDDFRRLLLALPPTPDPPGPDDPPGSDDPPGPDDPPEPVPLPESAEMAALRVQLEDCADELDAANALLAAARIEGLKVLATESETVSELATKLAAAVSDLATCQVSLTSANALVADLKSQLGAHHQGDGE